MDAIETLMQEHRAIEQVLDALVGFADEVVRAGRTEPGELSRFVTFLREFADHRHHAKEEDVLFEAMAVHGFPTRGGPIAVMLAEHEQGRALIRALGDLAGSDAWDDGDRVRLAVAARSYASLLRAHIQKEDTILYPMAERHVPEDALERVTAECRALDAGGEPGAAERLAALGEALAAAYGPGASRARRSA